MDVFTLLRNWFNFSFENPDKVRPIHTHLYFFLVDKNNRLGNVEKFGLPTERTMDQLGIKSRVTYTDCINFLIENGFVIMVQKSNNQHYASVISLVKKQRILDTALDKSEIYAGKENIRSVKQPTIQPDIQSVIQPTIQPNVQPSIHIVIQGNKETKKQDYKETRIQVPSENEFSVSKIFRPIFEEFYFEKKNEKYYWTGKDGAKCKALANKLIFKIKEKENLSGKKENEDYKSDLPEAFRYLLSKISDDWILSNLSMAIIDSKFNEIITSKQNGNNTFKKSKSDASSRKQSVENLKGLSESILDDFASKNG